MKFLFRHGFLCLFILFTLLASTEQSFAACPAGQQQNYIVRGKCVKKTDAAAGLKLFSTKGCVACHGVKTTNICAIPGGCTYKKMAQNLKATNGSATTVTPAKFKSLFHTYSGFMPGFATPSTADATKYINYLSTVKQ